MGDANRLLVHALRPDMDLKPLGPRLIGGDAAARLHES